jgi:Ca2+-binding RTX toxin-like protein
VREPLRFANCEILIAKTVRDLGLAPERPNPQFVDETGEHGIATNAGLQGAGLPGAGAVARVNNYNADQPQPRFGQATNGNDSLSVRGGKALANDGALYGRGGNDRLEGGDDGDQLYGGSGNDGVYGRGGDDILVGGSGTDTIEGGRGADLLDGGPGDDRLNGGFGEDSLSGGSGNDKIVSLSGGRDTINCGPGNDRVIKDRSDIAINCERVG